MGYYKNTTYYGPNCQDVTDNSYEARLERGEVSKVDYTEIEITKMIGKYITVEKYDNLYCGKLGYNNGRYYFTGYDYDNPNSPHFTLKDVMAVDKLWIRVK